VGVPIPTDEAVPLSSPKIISELLALNYGIRRLSRVVVFRHHNVFGPDMGDEHVFPQLITRLRAAADAQPILELPIQGNGTETRAFLYIDDFTRGFLILLEAGRHREIYHIGSMKETSIVEVARAIAALSERELRMVSTASEKEARSAAGPTRQRWRRWAGSRKSLSPRDYAKHSDGTGAQDVRMSGCEVEELPYIAKVGLLTG
jgi:nucleoside-diphosphate-sugar epimerase